MNRLYLAVVGATVCLMAVRLNAQDDGPDARVLYSIAADGTDLKLFYELHEYDTISSPAASSDGRLAFAAWNRADGEDRTNSKIYSVTYRTRISLKEIGDGAMPGWSPRSKRMVFTRFSPNKGVWVMKSDGLNKVLLDRLGSNARWSPNGNQIAYVKTARGARTIAVYDLVEDRYFELWEDTGSPFGVISGAFAWSPDSKRICLRGRRLIDDGEGVDDDSQILIVSLSDSSTQKLCDTCQDGEFPSIAWSPDGRQIVYSRSAGQGRPVQLYSFDPASDEIPRLFPGQNANRNNASPCWSADGTTLIFASSPATTDETDN